MSIYVNARAIIERESNAGTEVLLQIRSRSGELERWELPGGQIDTFEPVLTALEREILEETGLTLTLVSEAQTRQVHDGPDAAVETIAPFFVYQTLRGPVDSLGFFFRCRVEGTSVEAGDAARQATWFTHQDLAMRFHRDPGQFDWLTQAALDRYLSMCPERPPQLRGDGTKRNGS